YIIWIDNLFTSIRLLERLWEEGIGGAGTVRTSRTKHAQVVLFASTVAKPEETIERERKRPAKTSTNAACMRLVFGNLAVKILKIPLFIDLYNHFMNGVD
ncbi:hypothetical protein K469DRAFT_579025, partial [Zopfia rhizophila CBS 207.26]